MYVDFAGDKLYLSDEMIDDKVSVEVFAAILPCSQITYYEAVPSQKKEYLIQACENAFHYFGGVPNAIVPDNLKSAVTKPGGIESVINDDFAAFADHYGCVVFPARVRKPKDKALVENAVRLLYREVYSKMTGLKFNDLEALNIEIIIHTDALNNRKMYNRSYSRRERFLEVEKDRHGLKSIIITSQLPDESWYDAIGDPTVADAILDRIVHSAHKIKLTGDSVRKMNAKKK